MTKQTNTIQEIQNIINTNIMNNNTEDLQPLAHPLQQYEKDILQNTSFALFQQGVDKRSCAFKQLSNFRGSGEKYLVEIGDIWHSQYEDCHKNVNNYQERVENIEKIIALLVPIKKKYYSSLKNKPEQYIKLLSVIAKAYYHRALLFQSKKDQIPEKKIESFNESMQYCDKVLNFQKNENCEEMKVWLLSYRELYKIYDEVNRTKDGNYFVTEEENNDSSKKTSKNHDQYYNEVICDKQKKYFTKDINEKKNDYIKKYVESKQIDNDLNDIILFFDYLRTVEKKEINIDEQLKKIIHIKTLKPKQISEIYKAIALFSLGKTFELQRKVQEAIQSAPKSFADPFWQELIDLIIMLKNEDCERWKIIAISAWEKCCENVEQIGNNIYLSWYWANQKRLYDLAFSAETDVEGKARIADSLKARSNLFLHGLQELKTKAYENNDHEQVQKINTIIEQDMNSRDNSFIVNILKRTDLNIEEEIIPPETDNEPISYTNLPEGWASIHFYLNELEYENGEKGGHALIYDPKSKKKWEVVPFCYKNLYQCYLEWEENYLHKSEKFDDFLLLLCIEIGKTMDFLFQKLVSKKIIWVPHGFLHRLPLHAAINNDKKEYTFFLEKYETIYLPAWHLQNINKDTVVENNENFIIKNFPESNFEGLCDSLKKNHKDIRDDSKKTDLQNAINKGAKNIAVICHGQCDRSNPFRSSLKLYEGDMTIFDIVTTPGSLSGTRVFIAACETDMTPPIEKSIDEYLSISSAFLSHGASYIAGGLWKIKPSKVNICYKRLLQKEQQEVFFSKALQEWQFRNLKNAKPESLPKLLYSYIPFRIIGFPK